MVRVNLEVIVRLVVAKPTGFPLNVYSGAFMIHEIINARIGRARSNYKFHLSFAFKVIF